MEGEAPICNGKLFDEFGYIARTEAAQAVLDGTCQESSFGTQAWCGCAPCTSGHWRFVGDKGFCGKGFAYFKYLL